MFGFSIQHRQTAKKHATQACHFRCAFPVSAIDRVEATRRACLLLLVYRRSLEKDQCEREAGTERRGRRPRSSGLRENRAFAGAGSVFGLSRTGPAGNGIRRDYAIANVHHAIRILRDVRFVSHQDNSVALRLQVIEESHDLFACL